MFNPLKSPAVINSLLDRAQKEINKAVKKNKKDYNRSDIWIKAQVDQKDMLPHLYVMDESEKVYEELLFADLLQDEEVQSQLNKVPKFIRKRINFDKIIARVNDAVSKTLGKEKYAKVTEGIDTARIDIMEAGEIVQSNIDLKTMVNEV